MYLALNIIDQKMEIKGREFNSPFSVPLSWVCLKYPKLPKENPRAWFVNYAELFGESPEIRKEIGFDNQLSLELLLNDNDFDLVSAWIACNVMKDPEQFTSSEKIFYEHCLKNKTSDMKNQIQLHALDYFGAEKFKALVEERMNSTPNLLRPGPLMTFQEAVSTLEDTLKNKAISTKIFKEALKTETDDFNGFQKTLSNQLHYTLEQFSVTPGDDEPVVISVLESLLAQITNLLRRISLNHYGHEQCNILELIELCDGELKISIPHFSREPADYSMKAEFLKLVRYNVANYSSIVSKLTRKEKATALNHEVSDGEVVVDFEMDGVAITAKSLDSVKLANFIKNLFN